MRKKLNVWVDTNIQVCLRRTVYSKCWNNFLGITCSNTGGKFAVGRTRKTVLGDEWDLYTFISRQNWSYLSFLWNVFQLHEMLRKCVIPVGWERLILNTDIDTDPSRVFIQSLLSSIKIIKVLFQWKGRDVKIYAFIVWICIPTMHE